MIIEHIEKYNQPTVTPELCVIWLHGLGADCNDFAPIVNELKLTRSIKFVFPNAPMRPITINNGYVMRGWYDIFDFSRLDGAIDHIGINNSVTQINQLIDEQIRLGFDSTKIILAGFSQGGVISYSTGLMSTHKLGGIIALSCYLPNLDKVVTTSSINTNTPIFAAHGVQDPVVPYAIGKLAYDNLHSKGLNIRWHEYNMPHSVCLEQLNDLSNWLNVL